MSPLQLGRLFEVAKGAPSTTPWWEDAMVALSTMVSMHLTVWCVFMRVARSIFKPLN